MSKKALNFSRSPVSGAIVYLGFQKEGNTNISLTMAANEVRKKSYKS